VKGNSRDRWLEDAPEPGAQALRRALDDGPSDEDSFARQRIWQRVQSPWAGESSRRTRGPLFAVAGALAVCAVIAGLAQRGPTPVATAPVVPAASLPPPASIALTTGPEEHARHRLARGAAAALGPRSALIPGDETTPPEVKVGRVGFDVPHQAPGRRYLVRAGAFNIVVIGTSFEIAVDDAGVGVSVSSGVVAVEEAGSGRALARLSPGMSWSSAAPAPARVRRPRVPRSEPRLDPAAAYARYQRLAAAGGPMAEVALYEMGVIEAEDQHDLPRALATWERHRARYPKGTLRPEADLSIVEALARLRRHDQALIEARAFLTRYPGSERRAEVARVAGDLLRTRGDCRGALGFYDLAVAAARADAGDVDDAAFHRAACLATLGDARASAAARDYLARFPLGRHAVDVQRLLAGGKVDAPAR
jgi:ferric-dicitrate binding protein FerR (iron transport regulator)